MHVERNYILLWEITPVEMQDQDSTEDGIGEGCGVKKGERNDRVVQDGDNLFGSPELDVILAADHARGGEPVDKVKTHIKIAALAWENTAAVFWDEMCRFFTLWP